jgi:hypothetical protein
MREAGPRREQGARQAPCVSESYETLTIPARGGYCQICQSARGSRHSGVVGVIGIFRQLCGGKPVGVGYAPLAHRLSRSSRPRFISLPPRSTSRESVAKSD